MILAPNHGISSTIWKKGIVNMLRGITAKGLSVATAIALGSYCYGALTAYTHRFPYTQIQFVRQAILGANVLDGDIAAKRQASLYATFSPPADVVMLGDSVTRGAFWNEVFPQAKIANRGVDGDTTGDILARMEQVLSVKPRKAFLMAGINDIFQEKTIGEIVENYKQIVQRLVGSGVNVYVQSTLECSKFRCGKKLQQVRQLNLQLKQLCAEEGWDYIDINENLTSDADGLLSDFTYDGLHLLGNGYVHWSEKIKPLIAN
jgi:lysophospholipase L1-like esterase